MRWLLLTLLLSACGDLESDRICLKGCIGQTPICQSMVACFDQTSGTPGALDPSFGPRGQCWLDQASHDVCAASCASTLANQIASFPDAGCAFPL